ncbi:MAG: hypothetical protein ACO4AC_10240, partial [Pseudohongiellaceae bacterium]
TCLMMVMAGRLSAKHLPVGEHGFKYSLLFRNLINYYLPYSLTFKRIIFDAQILLFTYSRFFIVVLRSG